MAAGFSRSISDHRFGIFLELAVSLVDQNLEVRHSTVSVFCLGGSGYLARVTMMADRARHCSRGKPIRNVKNASVRLS